MRPLAKHACPLCEQYKWDQLADEHTADVLAAQDPANDPTHKPATDEEWWAWVMNGGRDE